MNSNILSDLHRPTYDKCQMASQYALDHFHDLIESDTLILKH